MSKNQVDKTAKDEDQKLYRDYFNITDMYLIQYSYDPDKKGDDKDGYIIFIDYEYDLDYVDLRNNDDKASEISRAIAKLQLAEAVPTKHLPKDIQLEFKRSLGIGYIHALNCQFEDIPKIIDNAQKYLKERNREFSRWLFLESGFPAVIMAFLAGFFMYISDYFNPWFFGVVFGILGAFVSIWARYGKIKNSGFGGFGLHLLECYSRIVIGVIFSLIAMVAIRCHLILPSIAQNEELLAFILASFIASFSERFIPSILEQITKDNENNTGSEA